MQSDNAGIIGFVKRHKYLVGSAIFLGVGTALLKYHFAGGVCRSKARLDGKTVIITGANTGIGKETAKDLARRGARVILACRDLTRANVAADEIKKDTKNDKIVVRKLDLASLQSVRDFSADILKSEPKIDILINNAGIMRCPYWKTEDGFEMQFGVNHLGHFLLTNLLLDRIKESAPARIVTVSSLAHTRIDGINFDDINSEKEYDPKKAYSQSKLANVLFTRELSKRLNGTGVTANSLHPGVIKTELGRHMNISWLYRQLLIPVFLIFIKTPEQGAQTTICCAVSEELNDVSGKYFSDCVIKEETEVAQDDAAAERLWKLSEEMVGMKNKQ